MEATVFCFAHKEEKEESFKEAYEENVEGEAEDAAVPALAGRVGDRRLLLFLLFLSLLFRNIRRC